MDCVDGFIMLAIIVLMSVSFVFGTMCQCLRSCDHNNKKPIVEEGLFQIKERDDAAVHLYSDCHQAQGAELISLERCDSCKCVIRPTKFCSSCTKRREKLKKTQ